MLRELYRDVRAALAGVGLEQYVEPYAHVNVTEALRQSFRPDLVRLVIVAESPVRKPDPDFRENGPGLVYNPQYPTPWWDDLLFPGFGGTRSKSIPYRAKCLRRMRECGVYVIDASIIALSGHQRVDSSWPRRPFDAYREQLIRDCWVRLTGHELDLIIARNPDVVVVLYTTVRDMLGRELRADVAERAFPLKFRCAGNERVYEEPDYPFGTQAFCTATKHAGLSASLKRIYAERERRLRFTRDPERGSG